MSNQNNIEHITVGLTAGDNKVFAMSGTYFELIDCPNTVDVFLQDFNGVQKARLIGASASFFSDDVEFGVIQISSSTAQTVKFAYGSGKTGTRRTTGSMAITNTPTVALQATDAALIRRPEPYSGNTAVSGAMAANTPETIFTPAANVNGAILLAAGLFDYGVATTDMSLIAKNAAPANVNDGAVYLRALTKGVISGAYAMSGELPKEQFVPAGLGLYCIANAATAAFSNRYTRFRLL